MATQQSSTRTCSLGPVCCTRQHNELECKRAWKGGQSRMQFCAGRKLPKLTFVWLLAAVLSLKSALGAALEVSAELGGRYESNASNSNLASDRLADGFFTAHLNAGTSGVWGRDWRWHAHLAGEGEQAFRFTGLSQIEGGIRLGVDRKFGLGWKAPRLQIDFYTACRGPQRATRDPVHAALARRACGRRSLGRCRGRRPSIHPRTPARQSPRQRMIEQNTHSTRCY